MERGTVDLNYLLRRNPDAYANVSGSMEYTQITGSVRFYNTPYGIMTVTSISGLPSSSEPCRNNFFAMHIHNGSECSGNESDPFSKAGTHYNPNGCPHPQHAGDMVPLFSVNGYAFSAYLTNSFTIDEILGKAVIVHDSADDFTTQPSGNSGNKIACGIIIK